jgi:hypothetical protein
MVGVGGDGGGVGVAGAGATVATGAGDVTGVDGVACEQATNSPRTARLMSPSLLETDAERGGLDLDHVRTRATRPCGTRDQLLGQAQVTRVCGFDRFEEPALCASQCASTCRHGRAS